MQNLISHWIKGLSVFDEIYIIQKDIVIPYFVEHENQSYYYAIFYVLSRLKVLYII